MDDVTMPDRIEDALRGRRPILTKADLAAALEELAARRAILDDTRKAAVVAIRKHLHFRFMAVGWRRYSKRWDEIAEQELRGEIARDEEDGASLKNPHPYNSLLYKAWERGFNRADLRARHDAAVSEQDTLHVAGITALCMKEDADAALAVEKKRAETLKFMAAGWRRLAVERIGAHEECEYERMHEANDAEDALLSEQHEHGKLREACKRVLAAADSSALFDRLGELRETMNSRDSKEVAKGTFGEVAKGTFAKERVVTIFVREDSCESDFPQVVAAFDPWDEALGINILKAGVLQALGHGSNIANVIRFVIVRKS